MREGHEVFAFVSEFKETEIQKLRNLNVSVVTYSLNRAGINPFSDLKTLFELKNKIRKIRPDIVFSYFTKPVVYGSLAAKLAKIQKIVGMIEGLGSPFTEHKNGQTITISMTFGIAELLPGEDFNQCLIRFHNRNAILFILQEFNRWHLIWIFTCFHNLTITHNHLF